MAVLLFVSGQSAEPKWTMTLDMNALPPTHGWFGMTTHAEVQCGVLRVTDNSSEGGEGHCYNIEWEADPAQEAVVEARLKVVESVGDAGVCLWVSNGVNEDGVQFHRDGFDLPYAKLDYAMDTTDAFHIYRLTIKGNDLRVEVDGKLAIDASGKFTHEAYQGRNVLSFGSCSSAAKGVSLWDYVRFRSPLKVESQVGRKPPRVEQITVFRQPDTYAVFPSLQRDPLTDRLSTSFRAGGPRSHIDAKGSRSVTLVSGDGGKTWEPGEPVPSAPFKGPNNRLIGVGCKWWQEYPAEKRDELAEQGYLVADVRSGVVAICAGAYRTWSDDDGKKWQREDLELPFTATLASGMNSVQLADGTILYPVYGRKTAAGPDSTWVLRSTDYGEIWQLAHVATHPDGKTHLNEPEILQLKKGRLLIVMRTGVGNDYLWQAFSDDRGATWHSLRDTRVKGHPPDLLRLADGRILLTYGYRHPPFYGIRAVVSKNEAKSWDLGHVWVLRDGGGGVDLGYPHSVQLKDGTVVTMYYFVEPGGMQYIACTRWRVP